MKKRLAFLIILLISLSLTLAACGDEEGTTEGETNNEETNNDLAEESGESVKLDFALWDSNQEPGLRQIADDFESENSGIEINFQVMGWDDYWTLLEAGATGGSLPDVFWMHSNEIFRYASNEMLLDLNDFIENSDLIDLNNYPEGITEIYNYDDNQYAIPKDYDTIGLW